MAAGTVGMIGKVASLGSAGGSSETNNSPWAGGIGTKILGWAGDPAGSSIGFFNQQRGIKRAKELQDFQIKQAEEQMRINRRNSALEALLGNQQAVANQVGLDWKQKFASAMRRG